LTLVDGNPIEKAAQQDPLVEAMTRRLRFEGIVSNGNRSAYFVGVGIDPENETKVSTRLFNPENDAGSFVNSQDKIGVTIGRGLAETLGVKLGDELTLIGQTAQGSANGIDVVVRGIVYVPLPNVSKRALFTSIDLAQKLIRLPGRYTEITFRLKHVDYTKEFLANLTPIANQNNASVIGWWEIQPIIPRVETIWNAIIGIVSILLFLSATLGVLNIIYMLVAERTVEIGTLMAIGATQGGIKFLFTLEGALIGFFGGTLGILIGNGVVAVMHSRGLNFDNPFGSGNVIIYPTISPMISAIVFAVATGICAIAAIFPAQKAASIEPVRAFRGQLN